MSINWTKPLEWSNGARATLVPDLSDRTVKCVEGCEDWTDNTGDRNAYVSASTGKILGCEAEEYPNIRNVAEAPKLKQREETLCEAAMCMWEQAINLFATDPQWKNYIEGVGYGQARLDVMEHVLALQTDYEAAADTYNMCFDWDFVPDWMANNLVITDQGLERSGA